MSDIFKTRNYKSEERFDLGKFMDFKGDVYDVITSPFLKGLKELPIKSYYKVKEGYREIDRISQKIYGTPFMAYYIQFYNDITDEILEDDVTLKLFSTTDLENLVVSLYN